MRVEFTYSQEDLVDASMRFTARSQSIRLMRLKRRIWASLLVWFFILALFRFTIKGVIGGLIAGLIVMAIDPMIYEYQLRKNLRKYVKERHGDENEFVCEVELLPEGLRTSSHESQSNNEWETIEDVVSTSDSVDIFGRKGGVIVRNRAFTTAAARQQFIDLARDYMNRARGLGLIKE
jgi:hypothetical protein